MTAKYEKIDLAGFKEKLAAGDYASLTGARRAIGRMTTWTEAQKNKARAIAESHFQGSSASKPVKEKPAKAAKKKVGKKAKAAKKASKRSMKQVRQKQSRANAETAQPASTVMQRLTETNLQIQALGQAIDHMGKTKELGCPSAHVQEGAKAAQQGLTAAVNNLCALTREASASGLMTAHEGDNGNPHMGVWNAAVDASSTSLLGASAPHVAPPAEDATPDE